MKLTGKDCRKQVLPERQKVILSQGFAVKGKEGPLEEGELEKAKNLAKKIE